MLSPKKTVITFLAFLLMTSVVALALTAFYPLNKNLVNWTTPEIPADIDAYLQKSEEPLHPKLGTEKAILWATPEKKKTAIAFVYIHGFSATRHEISPVMEDLSAKFHANIFFTRLQGHGLGVKDFDQASAVHWIADANEALAIGKRLGDKVVLVGTSTGVPLILHLLNHEDPALTGAVFISANFRPHRLESVLSGGLLGPFVTRLALGEKGYSWKPKNPEQEYYWTTTYPPGAIHQLMELLKYANSIDLSRIRIPSLWIYTHNDKVVNTDLIQEKFQEIGSVHKKIVDTGARSHVLAGAITNPSETGKAEDLIQEFLTENVK